MERDENNRKLAEWLGWKANDSRTRWHSPECQRDETPASMCNGKVPDFYTDESANALLLEKMPQPVLQKVFSNDPDLPDGDFNWFCFNDCDGTGISVKAKDRKTAIVNAALAYIQAKEKEG